MEKENYESPESFGLHLGFKISKLVLKAALVGAAYCISKELHKIHKAIERKNEK